MIWFCNDVNILLHEWFGFAMMSIFYCMNNTIRGYLAIKSISYCMIDTIFGCFAMKSMPYRMNNDLLIGLAWIHMKSQRLIMFLLAQVSSFIYVMIAWIMLMNTKWKVSWKSIATSSVFPSNWMVNGSTRFNPFGSWYELNRVMFLYCKFDFW